MRAPIQDWAHGRLAGRAPRDQPDTRFECRASLESSCRDVDFAFPSFAGHMDIGLVPAKQPLTVEYVLQTRASGMMAFNSAIAAINDPFLLDTDPVQGSPFAPTLTLAPAPQPATALMLAAGLALIGRLRRPVRAMGRETS